MDNALVIRHLLFLYLNLFPFFVVAFRMYDLDGDEKISKEELLAVLTMMVGANISEEQLMSIAERTIHEADEDKDTLISFDVSKSIHKVCRVICNREHSLPTLIRYFRDHT